MLITVFLVLHFDVPKTDCFYSNVLYLNDHPYKIPHQYIGGIAAAAAAAHTHTHTPF